jgi:hypothetical protein
MRQSHIRVIKNMLFMVMLLTSNYLVMDVMADEKPAGKPCVSLSAHFSVKFPKIYNQCLIILKYS